MILGLLLIAVAQAADPVVAVIDTGIDVNHPALSRSIWADPKTPGVYGWDFVTNRSNPPDENGHGTHISGIIHSVSPRAKLMSARYYLESNPGSVNLRNTIKAIHYALDNGARIINYSAGGPEFSEDEYLAIKRANDMGVLFVAAAGNDGRDTNLIENYYYPAAYRLPNIIVVASTTIAGTLHSTSNWGSKQVHIGAPGELIYSAYPGGRYVYLSGTSQATAFVTGAAAYLLEHNSKLSPSQIIQILTESADKLPALKDKVFSGGRLNVFSAIKTLKSYEIPVGRSK